MGVRSDGAGVQGTSLDAGSRERPNRLTQSASTVVAGPSSHQALESSTKRRRGAAVSLREDRPTWTSIVVFLLRFRRPEHRDATVTADRGGDVVRRQGHKHVVV